MPSTPAVPIAVRGALDPRLSRGLWLVKWLLALPHVVVLWFLWLAYGLVTVIAFFAILATARYPRALFDFNVGVLRWTWRVAFYAYGVLGTDRYPPFTLADDPSYPATLTVAYPPRLSRGLALVKWWLLALPHYAVVAILVGGGGFALARFDDWSWTWWGWAWWEWTWSGGLATLLVLYAAVALLFTGRYPRGIFAFVVGAHRWALRVVAYATLLTDAYPPFRLDQGGEEPAPTPPGPDADGPPAGASPPHGTGPAAVGPPPAAPAAQAPSGAARWSAGRIVAVALAGVVALAGLATALGGAAVVAVDQTQREDGYVTSPWESFSTRGHALVSEEIDLAIDGPDWLVDDVLGDVRIESRGDRPLFVGVAREADAARYLDGVSRSVVDDIGHAGVGGRYATRAGGPPPTPPGEQRFWAAASDDARDGALTWAAQDGRWTVVVMNADGSAGVDAELRVGAELPDLLWIGLGVLAFGLLLLAVAAVIVYLATPRAAP
mgnify:CR=1 FL=1